MAGGCHTARCTQACPTCTSHQDCPPCSQGRGHQRNSSCTTRTHSSPPPSSAARPHTRLTADLKLPPTPAPPPPALWLGAPSTLRLHLLPFRAPRNLLLLIILPSPRTFYWLSDRLELPRGTNSQLSPWVLFLSCLLSPPHPPPLRTKSWKGCSHLPHLSPLHLQPAPCALLRRRRLRSP